MGCNVSPYRGGVLKYKETVDKTVNVIQNDYTTLYDVYIADRPCVIKVNTGGGNINVNLWVNSEMCGTISAANSTLTTVASSKYLIATATNSNSNAAGSMTFLLDVGETLQCSCNSGAGQTDPHIVFKIHVYEWE